MFEFLTVLPYMAAFLIVLGVIFMVPEGGQPPVQPPQEPQGQMYPPPQKKSNTTTIVVVVIVVLGILFFVCAIGAAILFPVFAQANEAAKKASCLSNQKQIALSLIMYAADFDETLPESSWAENVEPYLGGPYESVFTCPHSSYGHSYGLNQEVLGSSYALMANPRDVVMSFEADGSDINFVGREGDLVFRHMDGAIYGFADGHAMYYKAQNVPSFEVDIFSEAEAAE